MSNAVEEWLTAAKDSPDNEIVNYLNQEGGAAKLAWAVEHAQVSTS